MQLLKKIWQHRLFVSVAVSETGAVRGMRIRAFWLASVAALLVASFITLALIGDLGRARIAATVSGNQELSEYLDQIANLEAQKSYQEEQVRTIAEELGLLQARLERYDALGEQLLADDMFSANLKADMPLPQGGPDMPELKEVPSLSQLQQQLGLVTYMADRTEEALETGISLATKAAAGKEAPYFWPVMDRRAFVSSGYGYRVHPITKRRHLHAGYDIAAGMGAAIVSAGDGVVVFSGYRYAYGILVEVRHANGFSTRYAHLNETTVQNGDVVKAGDLIGLMGSTGRSTGPHLHFEILKGKEKLNPVPFIRDTRKHVIQMAREGRGKELLSTYKATKAARKQAALTQTDNNS